MRGRKPLPTAVKELRGNPGKRALNKNEPKPRAALPRAPRWLDEVGKKKWKTTSRMLYRLGLLTEADVDALAAYCDCHSTMMLAKTAIKEHGVYVSGAQGQNVKNPAFSILETAKAQMKMYQVEFGMTPSSRSRVKLPDKPEDDPFETWVKKQLEDPE
jgi:P27 family predicted phage terminase small subunit